MAIQSKCSSTLLRPFFPILFLKSSSLINLFIPSAKSLENLSGSIGSNGAAVCCCSGINNPVSP